METKKKTGPLPKDPQLKKRGVLLSLNALERQNLEDAAKKAGHATVSEFLITRFKLDRKPKPTQ